MRGIDLKIADVVKSRKETLRTRDAQTLRALPSYSSEELSIENRTFTIGIYRETISPDENLIVVQCYNQKSKFLWMTAGTMHAEGFVIQADGSLREAEDKLLWDYT